jgi:hypothetical protein
MFTGAGIFTSSFYCLLYEADGKMLFPWSHACKFLGFCVAGRRQSEEVGQKSAKPIKLSIRQQSLTI